ncbi:MAG: glycosyltransferase [Lachnospiraceae bacterium]|nr:glycosyltransferase [Lachnospiraceae bacterium]
MMSEKELVSVVMAAYKEKNLYIRRAIESILNQTYRNFELIIVLDNPENKELEGIIWEYVEKDARVKFLINEKNMGAHETRNRAIRHSCGKYIAIMDADDMSLGDRLMLQVTAMEERNVDVISGFVEVMDENENLIYAMKNLPEKTEDINRKLRINDCMPHPALMVRKDVYQKLGGYNKVPYGCEDYEFLVRASLKGYKLYNVPKIILKYRMTMSSLSRNHLYQQYLMMRYCQRKYFDRKELGDYESFIKQYYTPKRAEKYSKAAGCFTEGVRAFSQKKYFRMAGMCLKAVVLSSDYRKKMFRYVFQLKL